MQSKDELPRCQYTDCQHGRGTVKYEIAHMAFCSQECHDAVMIRRYSSAGVLPVSSLGGKPSICLGSDKNRRRDLSLSDPVAYGLEIFGGARDKDAHAEITANREFREESGINIDRDTLAKYLAYAPVVVKPFIQKGQLVYYVVFLLHIEDLNTVVMNKAWQSRVSAGSAYECTEMDMCFQLVIDHGEWKLANSALGSETAMPTICKYHLPVLNRVADEGYLTAVLEHLPSVNSLGIWQPGSYLLV